MILCDFLIAGMLCVDIQKQERSRMGLSLRLKTHGDDAPIRWIAFKFFDIFGHTGEYSSDVKENCEPSLSECVTG